MKKRNKTRPLQTKEKQALDDAWNEYLDHYHSSNITAASVNQAWDKYQSVLQSLNIGSTLGGYRVFLEDENA